MTSNAYRERLKSVAKDYAKLPHLKRQLNEKNVSSKINSIIYNDKKDFLIIEDSSSNNHVQILKASNNGAVDSWDGSGALEAVPGVTRSNYLNSTEVARFVSESDVKRAFGRKFKDIYKDTNLKVYGIRPGGMYSVGEDNIGRKVWCDVLDDFTSYESDPTRFFYEVFDENGVCENKFICIETVTNTGVGTNSDQTHTTIKIYNVPIYDHRHDTYIHRDEESFIADVWFVNASKSLTNKKYSHIDICKSNFTTLVDIFKSITYVNPGEIQTLVNKKLLIHSDHHFLPPGLTETELQNFIKSNWSQIYNKDYNYEFFHSSGANSGIMREVHNVKVEKNVVTNKYRYTTAGKSKANITPSTITVDSVNHTYTGTLSSSTYSGYKLAANTNKIVSSGSHTLTGYTGNNITLAITGNTVNVTNSKTSTTRTTELQNFIKSNWSQKFWKRTNLGYNIARSLGYGMDPTFELSDRFCQRIEVSLTRLSSPISYSNDNWGCTEITYYSTNLADAYTQSYKGQDVYSPHMFFNNVDVMEHLFRNGKYLILEICHRFKFFGETLYPRNHAAGIVW